MSMNAVSAHKKQKTYQRILVIQSEIKAHLKNIKLLNFYAVNYRKISIANKKFRLVNFNSLGRNEHIRRMTLKNLNDQIFKLEIELATLIKYGA
jgi:hypothetical protein